MLWMRESLTKGKAGAAHRPEIEEGNAMGFRQHVTESVALTDDISWMG